MRSRGVFPAVLLVLAALLVAAVQPALAEKRVALVIGNSAYEHVGKLDNAQNDAGELAKAFERLGFDTVSLKKDMDYREMRLALKEFSRAAAGSDIAMIYYAGHGIEVSGTNYLIPTDAKLAEAGDVDFEAIPLSSVLGAVEGARRLRLVVLDACRDNPFRARMARSTRTRSIGRGLARVEPESNVLVAFAAKEGTVALDGTGQHSPYAAALLSHVEQPGLEIGFLFRKVRDSVLEATGGKQEPFVYGSLGGSSVYLKPPAETATTSTVQSPDELLALKSRLAELEERLKSQVEKPDAQDDRTKLAVGTFQETQPEAAGGPPGAPLEPETRLTVKAKLRQAEVGGRKRTLLGVRIRNGSALLKTCFGLPEPFGAHVDSVSPDSAALEAGLKPGDVILAFDDKPVETMRDLVRMTSLEPGGAVVSLDVLRISTTARSIARIEERAGRGDTDAMLCMGYVMEYHGGTAPTVTADAGRWYRKAADAGNAYAARAVGAMYQAGSGVTKDEVEAIRWYRKAAEGGYEVAMNDLGVLYQTGKVVPKDVSEAARWYRKAAEKGHTFAMNNLARLLQSGEGVPKDEAEALAWYRKAAAGGLTEAMNSVGTFLAEGTGGPKDEKEAVNWFQQSADQGNAQAMYNMGIMTLYGRGLTKDPAGAARWYRKSAEMGNSLAMFSLGLLYASGNGVGKDGAEALAWYRKAAEAGHDDAMRHVGIAYYNGEGVAREYGEAVRWFRKAADKENAAAMHHIGNAYRDGHGVAKDLKEAVRWYKLASAKGNLSAKYELARHAGGGAGTELDTSLSARLLFEGIQAGDGFALKEMKTNSNAWRIEVRRELQRLMQQAGYYQGALDGSFGAGTVSALDALFNSGRR